MSTKGPQKDSLHAFAGKMAATGVALKAVAPKAAAAGAAVINATVSAELGRTTRGGRLRGVGKKGAKVGVRTRVFGATAYVRATGPLHILERDMPEHVMGKPGGKLYRVPGAGSRGQGIAVPQIHHPGSKGKHPFEKGVLAGKVPAERVMHQVVATSVATALR